MARLVISDDAVTLKLSGAEKIEALHGDVTVPRSAIVAVRAVPDGMAELHGMRVGTGIPGVLVVGKLLDQGFRAFAVCRAGRPAVVIDLAGQDYDRLVVTLDDAASVAASVSAA
jgi:hypothetical protein